MWMLSGAKDLGKNASLAKATNSEFHRKRELDDKMHMKRN